MSTESGTETLVVDGLSFQLRRSARRNTLGITVERDGSLVIAAPVDCSQAVIERSAREKLFWLHTKLARKRLMLPGAGDKEYVSGEGFYYLGRSHRLLITEPNTEDKCAAPPLSLHHGRFLLRRDELQRASRHFVDWYVRHAQPWIERRVALYSERIGVEPGHVRVGELGNRWGSCGKGGNLNFNWLTICLPPRAIEYVVAHELVHLREPHHGPEFWQRLGRCMPDFEERKRWLAENGALYQHQ